jgi:hypothetical protein
MEQDNTESQAASRFGQSTVLDPGEFDLLRRRPKKYDDIGLEHEPENFPDLRYIYEQQYEIHILRGRAVEPYRQFKTAVGQLARFAVAADVGKATVLAEAGGLFHLETRSELIREFIGGLFSTKEPSTVATKSYLLVVLCRMAKLHYGGTRQVKNLC